MSIIMITSTSMEFILDKIIAVGFKIMFLSLEGAARFNVSFQVPIKLFKSVVLKSISPFRCIMRRYQPGEMTLSMQGDH